MKRPIHQLDRRGFIARAGVNSLAVTAGLSAGGWWTFPTSVAAQSSEPQDGRPTIAFLGTVVRKDSHAQHFLDRHTPGSAWRGEWQHPRVRVASVYIDQFPDDDLARERIKRHRLKQYPSIEEALTLGGEELAVDGVVLIGEHGDYPTNEKGQKRYPRYDWFKKVVNVFESSGRAVPVFNDKHLSTEWPECVEMVQDSKRLDFPFLAGSSLPVTRRIPAVEMPYGASLRESVCVAYGGVDSYDVHALETAQCMSERRAGGEVGVREVHALKGEGLWNRLAQDDCQTTRELIVSALTRSHNLAVEGGFPTEAPSIDWLKRNYPQTVGYLVQHRDDLRTTILLTGIRDFNYAGMLDDGSVVSCQMYLPMPGHGSTTADFFNPLVRHIEETILKSKTPYPVERTLLTSGIVIAGVDSLFRGQQRVATPHLNIRYMPGRESTFWMD